LKLSLYVSCYDVYSDVAIKKKIGQKKDSQYNVYMYKERDKKPIYTYSSE